MDIIYSTLVLTLWMYNTACHGIFWQNLHHLTLNTTSGSHLSMITDLSSRTSEDIFVVGGWPIIVSEKNSGLFAFSGHLGESTILLIGYDSYKSTNQQIWLSPMCYCYMDGDPDPDYTAVVQLCDAEQRTRSLYIEISQTVITRGHWGEVILIAAQSDVYTEWNIHHSHKVLHFDCSEDAKIITNFLQSTYSRADYRNIVVDCDSQQSKRIIQDILLSKRSVTWPNLNWLLINMSTVEFADVQSYFIEGDNAVLLHHRSTHIQFSDFISNISSGHIPELLFVDVYWCFLECNNSTWKDTWTFTNLTDISKSDINPLHENFKEFFGHQLTVTWGRYPPFCYKEVMNDTDIHKGIELDLIQALSESLNFRYKLVYTVDGKTGSLIGNNTWSGMVGMLMRGEADVGMCGISLSHARDQVIDYLHPHWEDSSAVLIRLTGVNLFFTQPYTYQVWIGVLILPTIAANLLLITHYINVRTSQPNTQSSKSTKIHPSEAVQEWSNTTLMMYGCLLQQGIEMPMRTCSARFLMASYWATVIILAAVYTGNLTATLTTSQLNVPLRTLDELAKSNYQMQVKNGSIQMQILKDAQNGTYKQLWDKIRVDPGLIASNKNVGFDRVVEKTRYAYTDDKSTLLRLMETCPDCSLHLLKEEYYKAGMALIVKEDMPYRRLFNKVILHILEQGLIQRWSRKHINATAAAESSSGSIEAFSIADMSMAFSHLLGVGIGAASLILIIENIIVHSKRSCRKHTVTVVETFNKPIT